MNEEPRIFLGERMFRIDLIFEELIEAGNADNKIPIESLKKEDHYYSGLIDNRTGAITTVEGDDDLSLFRIPRTVLQEGYDEGSDFAEKFNKKFAEAIGIQLVDKQVLLELEDLPLQHTLRDLPTIEIGGFSFEIDVSMNELRRVDQLLSSVKISDMEIENGRYVFYLDAQGFPNTHSYGNDIRYELEQLIVLVPDEVMRVFGISKDQLPNEDTHLYSHPDLIAGRIEKGRLPIVRIVDEDYYVDVRMEELRSCNKFWKTIPLDSMHEDQHGHFLYAYDYLNRKVVEIDDDITEMPKHTVFVMLPDLLALDPIGEARKYGNEQDFLLDFCPIQPKMEARIIPLEQTHLPTLIKENRVRLDLQNSTEIEKISTSSRKKRGLGQ